jgi:hypothetical protein
MAQNEGRGKKIVRGYELDEKVEDVAAEPVVLREKVENL